MSAGRRAASELTKAPLLELSDAGEAEAGAPLVGAKAAVDEETAGVAIFSSSERDAAAVAAAAKTGNRSACSGQSLASARCNSRRTAGGCGSANDSRTQQKAVWCGDGGILRGGVTLELRGPLGVSATVLRAEPQPQSDYVSMCTD